MNKAVILLLVLILLLILVACNCTVSAPHWQKAQELCANNGGVAEVGGTYTWRNERTGNINYNMDGMCNNGAQFIDFNWEEP